MATMTIEMPVQKLADAIKHLSSEEKETLLFLLSGKGKELLKRKDELESGKVKPVTQAEIFNA